MPWKLYKFLASPHLGKGDFAMPFCCYVGLLTSKHLKEINIRKNK